MGTSAMCPHCLEGKNLNTMKEYSECPFDAAAFGFKPGSCLHLFEGSSMDWSAFPPYFGFVSKFTVPADLKLVSQDGSVVGDEICVGDKFSLAKGVPKGEYWQDGGHEDSPPLYWVNDVLKVVDKILDYHKKTTTRIEDVCPTQKVADGFIDPVTGIPVYSIMITEELYGYGESLPATFVGNMICSLRARNITYTGASGDGVYYKATGAGDISFNAVYDVTCMYYLYGGEGGLSMGLPGGLTPFVTTGEARPGCAKGFHTYKVPLVIQAGPDATAEDWCTQNVRFDSKQDFFKIGSIGISKTIKVISPKNASIALSASGVDQMKFGEENIIRVLVKNTGDTDITIKKVSANSEYRFVSCDSDAVKAGEVSECIVVVIPAAGRGLRIDVVYEYKSCGKTAKAQSSLVLSQSKTVSPKASVQVYNVGVHSGCENSYYGCVPSDQNGNFVAGYECYNQNDKYYSAGKERFDLKYELPDLSSKKILGTSLNLAAGKVNKPQTLSLYSVNNDWAPATCRAGGDICTQPYCGECKSLFELSGERVAETEARSMGLLSFDISDSVKAAYASGNKVLSFQVRGEEDIWETGGTGSCGGVNAWSEQDAEVQGAAGSQPYMEIVYG